MWCRKLNMRWSIGLLIVILFQLAFTQLKLGAGFPKWCFSQLFECPLNGANQLIDRVFDSMSWMRWIYLTSNGEEVQQWWSVAFRGRLFSVVVLNYRHWTSECITYKTLVSEKKLLIICRWHCQYWNQFFVTTGPLKSSVSRSAPWLWTS